MIIKPRYEEHKCRHCNRKVFVPIWSDEKPDICPTCDQPMQGLSHRERIEELEEKQEYYDEYITKGIDPFIEDLNELSDKVAELVSRLDTWDRRLAKWAKKMGLEK